jgi:hypothetical protein
MTKYEWQVQVVKQEGTKREVPTFVLPASLGLIAPIDALATVREMFEPLQVRGVVMDSDCNCFFL